MAEWRTFIAVAVEPAIIARLTALQTELRAAGAAVAWVQPAGMHLTLKFLGNVPEGRISEIGEALAEAVCGHAPFTVTIAGAGGFPNLVRPRVLWAGIAAGESGLVALATAVENALAARGFPREPRPFHPHLTLGRLRSSAGIVPLLVRLDAHADDDFGAMDVTEIALYRSELSPHGTKYCKLRAAKLAE